MKKSKRKELKAVLEAVVAKVGRLTDEGNLEVSEWIEDEGMVAVEFKNRAPNLFLPARKGDSFPEFVGRTLIDQLLLREMKGLLGAFKVSIEPEEDYQILLGLTESNRSSQGQKEKPKMAKKKAVKKAEAEVEEIEVSVGDIVSVTGKSWDGWELKVLEIEGTRFTYEAKLRKANYSGRTYLKRITGVVEEPEFWNGDDGEDE